MRSGSHTHTHTHTHTHARTHARTHTHIEKAMRALTRDLQYPSLESEKDDRLMVARPFTGALVVPGQPSSSSTDRPRLSILGNISNYRWPPERTSATPVLVSSANHCDRLAAHEQAATPAELTISKQFPALCCLQTAGKAFHVHHNGKSVLRRRWSSVDPQQH